jgi:hypothetical protein
MRDLMMIVEGVAEHGTSAASPAEQFITSECLSYPVFIDA